jgi:hypothetical protein
MRCVPEAVVLVEAEAPLEAGVLLEEVVPLKGA